MPKVGKPDAEWHRAMQEFAQSRAKTMPRGCAPPKKSKWYSVMVKIINCPFGTRHVLRPTEIRGCECGYHQPKAAASPVPQGSEAKCPTTLITTTIPKKPDSLLVGDIRGKNGFAPQAANTLRVYLYGPTIGQCTSCYARDMRVNAVSKLKLIYTDSWPIFAQGLDLKCKKCGSHCTTFDGNYIKTLPRHMQNMPFVAYGAAFGVGKSLILALRLGTAAKNLEEQVRANLTRDYTACKRNYEHDAARKVELKIASGYEPYGNFPEEFVPKSPALLQALLSDYYQHRDSLRREQRALRSTNALGIDHQAKVVGRVKKDPTGQAVGTQSFSIVGDLGLVLGYYVVPDTSGVWLEKAMTEVLDRHGETVPPIVYVDCNCCNGKLRSTHDEPAPSPDQKVGGWETRVVKKLDIMHLLLRLSQAVFTDSSEDTQRLEEIRAKAGLNLTAEQKRIDRYRYLGLQLGPNESSHDVIQRCQFKLDFSHLTVGFPVRSPMPPLAEAA
ncbi:hypothetical protein FOZ62_003690 [Perkinsus olseni]|uniref:Uncharacterized protein n=1 Tax=Perkinsus olseni TaxID=32597 RepID=A0A7J6QJB3_PEROL|nr:hypothetical protein FOZ62_003690 [Perkinsus olseni]